MGTAREQRLLAAALIAAAAVLGHPATACPQDSYQLEPVDLPPGLALTGYAASMNASGDVLANLRSSAPSGPLEVWLRRNGAWSSLSTSAAAKGAVGHAVTDGREVVGESGLRPFLWDALGAPTPLRHVHGIFGTSAEDSNGRGMVVGFSYEGGTPVTAACIWRRGVLESVPIGPSDYGWEYHGVNATGWTCGLAYPGSGPVERPLLVDPAGNEIVIALPPPFDGGFLRAINDSATAVGSAYGSATPAQALYVVGGVAQVLPPVAGLLTTELTAVNRHGHAAGVGSDGARAYGVVSDGSQVRLVEALLSAPAKGQWHVLATHGIDRRGAVLARVRPTGAPPGSPPTLARLVPRP